MQNPDPETIPAHIWEAIHDRTVAMAIECDKAEDDESLIEMFANICDTAARDLKQFTENDQVPLQTALQFINQIKRATTKTVLWLIDTETQDEEDKTA